MGVYAMTGGATGIGAAIKSHLLAAGHRVIVADLKDADVIVDLSSAEGRQKAIEGIREQAGEGLDGLITCAGVAAHVPNHSLISNVNYFGTTEVVDGLRDLLANNRGNIILISSNSAPMCGEPEYVELLLSGDQQKATEKAEQIEGMHVYSGSKQAVARWMRRNTAELAAQGININAIAPGYTETPMTAAVADDPVYGDSIRQFVASIPIGRPGIPEDMANAVDFLLSDKASFICGSVLFIDGGHDAMLRSEHF